MTPTCSEHIPPQAFVEEALSKCTLYELLNTQEGFLTLQSYFIQVAMLLDRYSSGPDAQVPNCFDPASSMAYLDIQAGMGGLTDQSRAAQQFFNQQQHLMTPLGVGNSSGGRMASFLGPFGGGHMST